MAERFPALAAELVLDHVGGFGDMQRSPLNCEQDEDGEDAVVGDCGWSSAWMLLCAVTSAPGGKLFANAGSVDDGGETFDSVVVDTSFGVVSNE